MIGKRKHIRMKLRKGGNAKYLASCYGKIIYDDYEGAAHAAFYKPSSVKPYKCQFGEHYHIGRKK